MTHSPSSAQSVACDRYQVLNQAGEALLAAGHSEAYEVVYRMMNEARAAFPTTALAEQSAAPMADPLRAAVESMVCMLENGEWAEHASTYKAPGDKLAARIEAAITDLHNELSGDSEQAEDMGGCEIEQPAGWYCTRDSHHNGPCAAKRLPASKQADESAANPPLTDQRVAFQLWAEKEWDGKRVPDAAWLGWIGHANESARRIPLNRLLHLASVHGVVADQRAVDYARALLAEQS